MDIIGKYIPGYHMYLALSIRGEYYPGYCRYTYLDIISKYLHTWPCVLEVNITLAIVGTVSFHR